MTLWLVHFDHNDDPGEATERDDLSAGDYGFGTYVIVEADDAEEAAEAARRLLTAPGSYTR